MTLRAVAPSAGGGGGGGTVDSVVPGTGITVNSANPANPVVTNNGVVTVTGTAVNNTDVHNPIVNSPPIATVSAVGVVKAGNDIGVAGDGTMALNLSLPSRGAGFVNAAQIVTANYTVTTSDYTILANATSGVIVVTLPTATPGNQGVVYVIKKIDASANTVTVNASTGGSTIDGAGTVVFTTEYQEITVQSAGNSTWVIISSVGLPIDASKITTGTLPVTRGGTGAATLTAHGVLVGEGTGTIVAIGPGTLGQVLTSNGASADPTFQASNQPNCSVSLAANQSVTASTNVQITFDTVEFNNGSAFSTTTHRFTPLRAGTYSVILVARVQTTLALTGSLFASISKNGTPIATNTEQGTVLGANTASIVVPRIITMNGTTDFLEGLVNLPGTSGTVIGGSSTTSYFQVYYIGP